MESSEAAVRRMSHLASHLAATPQNSCTSSLTSMVCSSSLGMQSSSRKDGRLLFGRQDSHLPGYLKDSCQCQDSSNASPASHGNARKDTRLMFARQGSHTRAFYMRECVEYQVSFPFDEERASCKQHEYTDVDRKCSLEHSHGKENTANLDDQPLFARTVKQTSDKTQAVEATFNLVPPTNAKNNELDWLPRMDIVESGASYVVTMELPGTQADGIRVEVNEDRLLVSGARSLQCWVDNTKQLEEAFYHRKDLSQGPFRVQWPMPRSINLDGVSAEFMEGYLRIFLPKSIR